MKKKLVTLVLGGMLAAVMSLAAETETVGNYTWIYRINGDTAEICKDGYDAAISPKPTGSLTIPLQFGGKPVTSIGARVFKGCRGLTNVSIPDSVTSIGDEAFYNCSSLQQLTIPDSVTSYGVNCFEGCPAYTLNLYRAIFSGGSGGGSPSVSTTIV